MELSDSSREVSSRVVRKEKALPTDVRSGDSEVESTCLERFSLTVLSNLASSVGESSPKENDSELSNRNVDRKSGVSRLRVLIS